MHHSSTQIVRLETIVLQPVVCLLVENEPIPDEVQEEQDTISTTGFVPISKGILITENRLQPKLDSIVTLKSEGGRSSPQKTIQQTSSEHVVVKSIFASSHQGNVIMFSSNASRQCTAMAAAAIAMAHLCSISEWNTAMMDRILENGNFMYTECIQKGKGDRKTGYLKVHDLPIIASISESYIRLDRSSDICEYVGYNKDDDVSREFNKFFVEHQHHSGIIISDRKSRAIIRLNEMYFLFDSHQQNDGQNAATFTFKNLDGLIAKYLSYYKVL